MHMYSARKTVLQNRAITRILKGEMCFATETRLDVQIGVARFPPLRVRFQRTISQKIPTTATKPMVKITVRTNGQPRAKTMA
jgi:hypothetical protein